MEEVRARVFISCGQHEGEERAIADRIAAKLTGLGFEPYVAVQEQTLKGLRENIFWHLEHSEYYVFVDFKREQLGNKLAYRGSLFSHQELAIASFLDMDVIVLQEKGVVRADGLMRYLQTNAEEFDDRGDVPDLVARRVKSAGWETGWRNELVLSICDPPFVDAQTSPASGVVNRFFHLEVRNLHRRTPALNCVAMVRSIARGSLEPSRLRAAEIYWAGSSVSQALIPPGGAREVDLGFIPHANPNVFAFNSFSTSTQYLEPLFDGMWRVNYVIAASNFPPAQFNARIILGATLDSAVVEKISD